MAELSAEQKVQHLEDLQKKVKKFAKAEKLRLKTEREFLQSVLDDSVDKVSDREDDDTLEEVFKDVEKFLGITKQKTEDT